MTQVGTRIDGYEIGLDPAIERRAPGVYGSMTAGAR